MELPERDIIHMQAPLNPATYTWNVHKFRSYPALTVNFK
jgi:hypothetical protein